MVLLIVILYANEGEYVMASIIILILKCFLLKKTLLSNAGSDELIMVNILHWDYKQELLDRHDAQMSVLLSTTARVTILKCTVCSRGTLNPKLSGTKGRLVISEFNPWL